MVVEQDQSIEKLAQFSWCINKSWLIREFSDICDCIDLECIMEPLINLSEIQFDFLRYAYSQ